MEYPHTTWNTHTHGIPTHMEYPHTWSTHTHGIPTHLEYPHTWNTHIPGIPTHMEYPHTWNTHTHGIPSYSTLTSGVAVPVSSLFSQESGCGQNVISFAYKLREIIKTKSQNTQKQHQQLLASLFMLSLNSSAA